jgi:hypothetical protein
MSEKHHAKISRRLTLVTIRIERIGNVDLNRTEIGTRHRDEEASGRVVLPVVVAIPGAGVTVGEEADIEVLENITSDISDLVLDPDKVVESVLFPLVALLANHDLEGFVIRIDSKRDILIVGVPAAEHLLGDGGEVFVDLAIQVVIAAV